jgi:hypothetical protein
MTKAISYTKDPHFATSKLRQQIRLGLMVAMVHSIELHVTGERFDPAVEQLSLEEDFYENSSSVRGVLSY